jgi:hypothetical protein
MTVIPAETHSRVEAFGRQEVNEGATIVPCIQALNHSSKLSADNIPRKQHP